MPVPRGYRQPVQRSAARSARLATVPCLGAPRPTGRPTRTGTRQLGNVPGSTLLVGALPPLATDSVMVHEVNWRDVVVNFRLLSKRSNSQSRVKLCPAGSQSTPEVA